MANMMDTPCATTRQRSMCSTQHTPPLPSWLHMRDKDMQTLVLRSVDKQVVSVNGLTSAGRANLPPRSEGGVEGEATLDGQQKWEEAQPVPPTLLTSSLKQLCGPHHC